MSQSAFYTTTTGTGKNLSAEVTLDTFVAGSNVVIFPQVELSAMNGAAATITLTARKTTSGDVLIFDYPIVAAKRTPANTVFGTPLDPIQLESGEKLVIRAVSTNASDTSVTWKIFWNNVRAVDAFDSNGAANAAAAGYFAPDWAQVANKTATVALTGTTIATTQKVDVDTIKTNPVVNNGTLTFPANATVASTTNISGGTITTVTNLTNLPSIPTGWITAAGIAASAFNGKGDWSTAGAQMDLVNAPNSTAITAIQSGLSKPGTAQTITANQSVNVTQWNGTATVSLSSTTIGTVNLVNTLTTYSGNTPQTGDAYAIVNDGTFGNSKLVRSTTPANTLSVDSAHAITLPASVPSGYATSANQTTILNAVNAITVNTARSAPRMPDFLARPTSGSVAYTADLYLYSLQGQLEDADSNTVTVHARNAAGTSLDAGLTSTTMTRLSIGFYRLTYTVASTDTAQAVYFDYSWAVGTLANRDGAATEVQDAENYLYLASIKAKTDQLTFNGSNLNANAMQWNGVNVTGMPMPTFSYTAPDNSSISAIKSKTDSLSFDGDGNVNANAAKLDGETPVQTAGKLWVVDGNGNAIAPASDTSLLLARLGAFAGSGINNVLGVLRAICRKLAGSTPTDIGGTYDNTTDSLEAQSDSAVTVDNEAIADAVDVKITESHGTGPYGGSGNTQIIGTVPDMPTAAINSDLTAAAGYDFSRQFTVTGLVSTDWTSFVFTIKADVESDDDSAALLSVLVSNPAGDDGLQVLNGEDPPDGAVGTLVVNTVTPNTLLTLSLNALAMEIPPSQRKAYQWEIARYIDGVKFQIGTGQFTILPAVIRD